MFLCQGHVLEVWPCVTLWDTFLYEGHVLISMFQYQVLVSILNRSFRSMGCFSWSFIVYIKDYFYFYGYMFIPSIQKTFIQKLNYLFVGFYVLCLLLLTCVTFSLILLLLCLRSLVVSKKKKIFFLHTGWDALQVKHLQVKVLKMLQ